MTIQINTPDEEQNAIMKKYAEIVESLVKIICEYENAFASTNAITRAYESVHWFHSFIMNGAKKKEVVSDEVIPKEGELIINKVID